eukprot:TRINITY_DN100485_c0_g1_i1.p1 TRINITY_DN100485_c0_g1~~TRINITY_DN100485_c0_g1_i1.p1  ORF type:complete len:168 (+),score=56.99 TRINITY_DN100485_c0_g1_i1:31-534(+)
MELEHESADRASTQQRGCTLESNAERIAKAGAWSKGIHVADPAGTMQRMYQTFIGKKLEQHEAEETTPENSGYKKASKESGKKAKKRKANSSSSSSSSSTSHKKKKVKNKKGKKDKRSKKQSKAGDNFKDRLKKERQEGDKEAELDPKFAAIISRFRKQVNPMLPSK